MSQFMYNKCLTRRALGSTEYVFAVTTTESTSFTLSTEAEFCVRKPSQLFSACTALAIFG